MDDYGQPTKREEEKTIQQVLHKLNPERQFEWCPGGCGQLVQNCMCSQMDHAINQIVNQLNNKK